MCRSSALNRSTREDRDVTLGSCERCYQLGEVSTVICQTPRELCPDCAADEAASPATRPPFIVAGWACVLAGILGAVAGFFLALIVLGR
jgi:hypothetical protein